MFGRYMHCKQFEKSFSSRYFHVISVPGISSEENETEWNEIDLEQGGNNNFMNIGISNGTETTGIEAGINNDGEDEENELCDEEVSEEVLYKLFEEAFFNENIPPEGQDDNKGTKLVRWICLFLT